MSSSNRISSARAASCRADSHDHALSFSGRLSVRMPTFPSTSRSMKDSRSLMLCSLQGEGFFAELLADRGELGHEQVPRCQFAPSTTIVWPVT